MHPRISVSGISTASWSLDDDFRLYAELGVTAIGVWLRKLDGATGGLESAARRVAAEGLRVTNVIGVGPLHLDAPEQWPTHQGRLRAVLDAAATMAADCLVLTTGPAGALTWEDAADALESALAPVLAHARDIGVPVALEHTNSLRVDVGFVHTLADALDLAVRLGTGVCMETNACWAERALGDTVAMGIDRIALVQVSDFVVGTLSTPNRAVPGDGDIPFARILAQLLQAGYSGVFDLELIGPRIEEEGYASALRRSVDALGLLLDDLGA